MRESQVIAYDCVPELPITALLNWLVFSCDTRHPVSTLRVFWDLDFSVSSILSRLPDDVQQSLSRAPHRARFDSYRLFYIPSKLFSVSRNHAEANFYDLSQYFPGDTEPASIAELQEKADLLMSTLSDLGISSPTTLSSPVAVARASGLLDEYQTAIPTVFDALEPHLGAHEVALQCTPREWVSNYQVGHWGGSELWDYDLSSAYPFHASQLLHLQDCSFSKSDELDETAYYGFLVGDFTVYPGHPLSFCSPFLADRGDGTLVNFAGAVPGYSCLLDEVRTLYRYSMGEFHLKSGWFLKPLNGVRPRLPFQQVMSQLYQSRSQSPTASFFLKRVMNGLIGKLLETRKDKDGNVIEYGDSYNPIYHSLCTTRTRLQVFDFLVQQGITKDELVHIGVDGVKSTRCIRLPSQVPMGGWRNTGSQSAFILSPGAIATPDRNYKRTGYGALLAGLLTKPAVHKYGKDDGIDLRRLFLNQNRVFPKLPETGRALLSNKYQSVPVVL